ncbi:MAG: hypothetical protein EBU82_04805, partial [Flavobacteriia bacterium]|nr:hypothetical protein [Flavobacteriia bacterium]
MGITKKYWKGVDELKQTPSFIQQRDNEFPYQSSLESFLGDEKLAEASSGRRDFLKFLGFSVAAATLVACEAPVTKAVPYVIKPEDVTPGLATWYASTYYDGISYASIVVKTREARPIFIKGNADFGFTKGGTNPQIIASVLGLYDGERLNGVRKKGSDENIAVSEADKAIVAALGKAKEVVVLTPRYALWEKPVPNTSPKPRTQNKVENKRIAVVTAYSCGGLTTDAEIDMNCPSLRNYPQGRTATGTTPIPNKTVACDKANLGRTFHLEGVGEVTCEDVGGGIKGAGR